MKNLLLAVLCLLSCVFSKAQTFTAGNLSVTMTDTMSHDSTSCTAYIWYQYDINVVSSFTGQTVYIIDTVSNLLIDSFTNTSGASPWNILIPYGTIGSYGSWDYFLHTNHYATFYSSILKIRTAVDTVITYNVDSMYIANPCEYDTVYGRVYADNNGNCVYDAGDVGLSSPNVSFTETLSTPAGVGWSQGWLNNMLGSGEFVIAGQKSWMVNYTVSLPPAYAFIFPASPCAAGPYTFTTLPQTVDFPVICTHNVDLAADVLTPEKVRLHTPFFISPYVTNTGCDQESGQLVLIKDSKALYDASLSAYPADYVNGDTLIWNYYNLSNTTGGAYWNGFLSHIYLDCDPTVAVGDTLCFRIYTHLPASDIDASNNDHTVCLPVVYSYDPNVKEVSPAGSGPAGNVPMDTDTLTYTLHFQNTGSDFAYNIRVVDTLDSHLNPATFKVLGSSHNMTPKWLAPGVVEFSFDNIYLPDSTSNEAGSHGAVKFSIALDPGLPVGTQIKNTGYIYFDLNTPVVTNTTHTTLSLPAAAVHEASTGETIKVYPNPATDHIIVEQLAGGELSIINVSGIVVLQQEIVNDKTSIDVSRLPAGVYMLKTTGNTVTATQRFTKY